jgi:hypothetical protein
MLIRGRLAPLIMRATLFLAVLTACGGSQHTQVQEVPIDLDGGGRSTSDLPPDEVSGTGTSVALPDGSAPPGVGPQSLDTQPDAGLPAPQGFVQRQGGLSEKECTDMVLAFAKLSAKEKHATAPVAADLDKDPVLANMITDCGASTTKKQQKCALASRTSGGWKKCME